MAEPKAPEGYKLFARAWGATNRDHDVRVLKNHGYRTRVVKRREAPYSYRPKSRTDRFYIYGKKAKK